MSFCKPILELYSNLLDDLEKKKVHALKLLNRHLTNDIEQWSSKRDLAYDRRSLYKKRKEGRILRTGQGVTFFGLVFQKMQL